MYDVEVRPLIREKGQGEVVRLHRPDYVARRDRSMASVTKISRFHVVNTCPVAAASAEIDLSVEITYQNFASYSGYIQRWSKRAQQLKNAKKVIFGFCKNT